MTKFLTGGAIAVLAIATASAAAQPAPPPPPGVAQGTTPAPMAPLPPPPPGAPEMRVRIMTDHVLTRDEVVRHVTEMFAKLDLNHDGYVTREEMEAFRQKFAGIAERGQEMAERAQGLAEMGRVMAEHFSDRGMPPLDRGAMFDKLDTNHDGVISREEFMAARPELREERFRFMRGPDGAPPAPGMPPAMHSKHTMGEMHGMHGLGMGHFGDRLFEMADTNHDGRVSLAEAQAAALAHFDKADLNHDGRITPDERQQVREIQIERRPS